MAFAMMNPWIAVNIRSQIPYGVNLTDVILDAFCQLHVWPEPNSVNLISPPASVFPMVHRIVKT